MMCISSHQSPVTSHQSPVTSHQSLNWQYGFVRALILSFTFCGASVFASAALSELPSTIQYKLANSVQDINYPASIDKVIENYSMETLFGYDAEPSESQQSALGFMSRIYLGKSNYSMASKKMILVKAGLQADAHLKMGVVYQLPQGFLVHFMQKSAVLEETMIAFYFEGFSSSSVLGMKEEISKALVSNQKAVFFNTLSPKFSNQYHFIQSLLVPMSFAESANGGLPALCGGSAQITTKAQGGENSMLKNAWNCTKGLGGGVWDSTGGLVTDTAHMLWSGAKGAGKAIIHPVETYEAASAEVKKYKAMFSDLEKSFGTLKEAYNQLPDEVKWKMGCEITCQLGTTGVISYLTMGGGSPAFLRTISKSLYRVAELLPAGSAAAEKAMNLSMKMSEKAVTHAAQLKPHLKESTQKDIADLEKTIHGIKKQKDEAQIIADKRHDIDLRISNLEFDQRSLNRSGAVLKAKQEAIAPMKNRLDLSDSVVLGMSWVARCRLRDKIRSSRDENLHKALMYFTGESDKILSDARWIKKTVDIESHGVAIPGHEHLDPIFQPVTLVRQDYLDKVKEAKWFEDKNLKQKAERIIDDFAKENGVSRDLLVFSHLEMSGRNNGVILDRLNEILNRNINKVEKEDIVKNQYYEDELKKLRAELASLSDVKVDLAQEKQAKIKLRELQQKLQLQSQDVSLSEKEKLAVGTYMGVTACRAAGTAVSPATSKEHQGAVK